MPDFPWEQLFGHIEPYLLPLIALLAGMALLAIVRARISLDKEKKLLELCETHYLPRLKEEKKALDLCKRLYLPRLEEKNIGPFAAAQQDAKEPRIDLTSSEAVEQRLEKLGNSPVQLESSYLSDRLFAILCSVDPANLVRKAPLLSDLREITLQREQSGFCTPLFRAITPTLLILGIFGTLMGVHQQLGVLGEAQKLEPLAKALWPGVAAVLGTIVLMGVRGWYNRALSQFISELDRYTILELLPFFQPPEHHDETMGELEKTLKELGTLSLGEKTQAISNRLGELGQQTNKTQDLFQSLPDLAETSLYVFKTLNNGMKQEGKNIARLLQSVMDTHAHALSFQGSLATAEERLADLGELFSDIARFAVPNGISMQRLYDKEEMDAYKLEMDESSRDHFGWGLNAARLRDLAATASQINESIQKMEATSEKIREQSAEINRFDEKIDAHIDSISQANSAIKETLERAMAEQGQQLNAWREQEEAFREQVEEAWKKIINMAPKAGKLQEQAKAAPYPHGWAGMTMRMKDFLWENRVKSAAILAVIVDLLVAGWLFLPHLRDSL